MPSSVSTPVHDRHPIVDGHSAGADWLVEVWRGGTDGEFQAHKIPREPNQTVLDVVTTIQRQRDSSLAYRFSCRVGMCGSCAMTVNGSPRWACRTTVERVAVGNRLRVAPLRNLPVIRDLVTDMAPFFDKWQRARGRFIPPAIPDDAAQTNKTPPATAPLSSIAPNAPERALANAAVECINCGICYAACDVVRANPDYLGPAALNRAWVAYNDKRDGDPEGILEAVTANGGCQNCHTHQSCASACPMALNPTRAIAGLKRAALWAGKPVTRRETERTK